MMLSRVTCGFAENEPAANTTQSDFAPAKRSIGFGLCSDQAPAPCATIAECNGVGLMRHKRRARSVTAGAWAPRLGLLGGNPGTPKKRAREFFICCFNVRHDREPGRWAGVPALCLTPVSWLPLPSRSPEYVSCLVHLTEAARPNVNSYSLLHTYREHSMEASALAGIRCLTRHSGSMGDVT